MGNVAVEAASDGVPDGTVLFSTARPGDRLSAQDDTSVRLSLATHGSAVPGVRNADASCHVFVSDATPIDDPLDTLDEDDRGKYIELCFDENIEQCI